LNPANQRTRPDQPKNPAVVLRQLPHCPQTMPDGLRVRFVMPQVQVIRPRIRPTMKDVWIQPAQIVINNNKRMFSNAFVLRN
jgi:hypothetical protein